MHLRTKDKIGNVPCKYFQHNNHRNSLYISFTPSPVNTKFLLTQFLSIFIKYLFKFVFSVSWIDLCSPTYRMSQNIFTIKRLAWLLGYVKVQRNLSQNLDIFPGYFDINYDNQKLLKKGKILSQISQCVC